jgi:hypothetical protein
MTMHKRRFLFVTGCLAAALVLVVSTAAQSQTVLSFGTSPNDYTMDEGGTVNIPISVARMAGDTVDDGSLTAMITVTGDGVSGANPSVNFYGLGFAAPTSNNNDEITIVFTATSIQVRRATLTAVSLSDPNGVNEMGELKITGTTGMGANMATATVIDDHRPTVMFKSESATALEGAEATVTLATDFGPGHMHNANGAYVHIEEVSSDGSRKVQLLTKGLTEASYDADGRLMVPLSGEENDESFKLTVLQDSDGRNDEIMLMLTKPGNGVQLGDMTMMTLNLIDDDEVEDEGTPTPTPALPIFGAFALGAGLLAVGRARLQRRRQRQLTR